MAFSWYIERQGKQYGPYPVATLKELAASGRLRRTDLVRREDQANSVAAGKIKGLFPEGDTAARSSASPPPLSAAEVAGTPATHAEPPPLPMAAPGLPIASVVPDRSAEGSEARSSGSRFTRIGAQVRELGETTKAVARLAAAQARRAHLMTVALPAAYLELGRDIFGDGRFRGEFPDLFAQITAARQEKARLGSVQVDRERQKTLAGKATEAATLMKSTAQAKLLSLKEESLLRQLGESSYDRHGEGSGPADLVRPIAECLSAIDGLDREIDGLSRVGQGRLITPKRMLAGAIVCFVAVMSLMAFSPVAKQDSNPKEPIAVPSVRDDMGDGSNRAGLVAGPSVRVDKAKQSPSAEIVHAEDWPSDRTRAAGVPSPETATLPDFSKVDYHYDFSKDDYESIPASARRERRSRPFEKPDLDETEAGDALLVGKWLEDEGFTDPEGRFVRHGDRVIWYDSDKRQKFREDRWLNGRCHGVRVTWHKNGSKWGESTFVQGKRHGESRQWYDDGKLILRASYLNGMKHGLYAEWHPNGQKKLETIYLEGKQEGEARTWHENGHLQEVSHYDDDKRNGPARFWNKEGVLWGEGNYKEGQPHGEVTYYLTSGSKKGQPMGTTLYESGTLVRPIVPPKETTRAEFIEKMKEGSVGYNFSRERAYWWTKDLWEVAFGPPDRGPQISRGGVDDRYIYQCLDGPVVLRRGSGIARRGQMIWVLEE